MASLTSGIDRNVDRHAQIGPEFREIEPCLDRLRQSHFGERERSASVAPGMNAPGIRIPYSGWRTRARRLRADKLLFAQVDLRLVPELDPVVGQGVREVDPAGDGGRMTELEVSQQLDDDVGLERLSQDRQHLELVVHADAFDMREHRGAAVAHELHLAAIAAFAERDDAGNGFGGFERDVEEDQIGRAPRQHRMQCTAVGKFLGIDAAAMQDQRHEIAGCSASASITRQSGVCEMRCRRPPCRCSPRADNCAGFALIAGADAP